MTQQAAWFRSLLRSPETEAWNDRKPRINSLAAMPELLASPPGLMLKFHGLWLSTVLQVGKGS